MEKYITVLYPIKVPLGIYCWKHEMPYEICDQFDNKWGGCTCNLNLGELHDTNKGVLKPERCLNLKHEVK